MPSTFPEHQKNQKKTYAWLRKLNMKIRKVFSREKICPPYIEDRLRRRRSMQKNMLKNTFYVFVFFGVKIWNLHSELCFIIGIDFLDALAVCVESLFWGQIWTHEGLVAHVRRLGKRAGAWMVVLSAVS